MLKEAKLRQLTDPIDTLAALFGIDKIELSLKLLADKATGVYTVAEPMLATLTRDDPNFLLRDKEASSNLWAEFINSIEQLRNPHTSFGYYELKNSAIAAFTAACTLAEQIPEVVIILPIDIGFTGGSSATGPLELDGGRNNKICVARWAPPSFIDLPTVSSLDGKKFRPPSPYFYLHIRPQGNGRQRDFKYLLATE